jgi:transposase
LRTIPGIGHVYAAGVISEIGKISAFPNDEALAKHAGLVWNKNESGKFSAEDTHMASKCNTYLRDYLIEAANNARLIRGEFAEYYNRKYLEVKTHARKRALSLTARKLVRLIFALLDKNETYSPDR